MRKDGEYCKKQGKERACKVYNNNNLIKIFKKDIEYGVLLDEYYEFSLNGDTLIDAFYKKGVKIGSYYEYHTNKKPKTYVFYGYEFGDTVYIRNYDSLGNIISEEGNIISMGGTYLENLNIDSQVTVMYGRIIPPNSEFSIKTYLYNVKTKDTLEPSKIYSLPEENNCTYYAEYKILKEGDYISNIYRELKDKDRGVTWTKEGLANFKFPYVESD